MEVTKLKKEDSFCLSEEIEKTAQKAKTGDVLEINRVNSSTVFLLLVKSTSSIWSVVNLSSSILWREGTIDLEETLQEMLSTSTYNGKTINKLTLHKSEKTNLTITL